MLEPDAPGLKESRYYLQRDDSIEFTYQYQRDREATSVLTSQSGKSPTQNTDHTTLHTLITTYTLGAANILLVHP